MNSDPVEAGETKWGYAFAGVLALGVACAVQFAFGELDPETLENMPAILAVPYAVAGKLGLTIPLVVLGLGLIVRDVLVYGGGRTTAKQTSQPVRPGAKATEELETGEPIEEASAPAGGAKIPAAGGSAEGPRVAQPVVRPTGKWF